MPLISVIVPFLNEELYIERCIRSLLAQDFDKDQYELIFIDNGSTDRSAEIVRGFPGIIFMKEEKRSSYAARNKGLGVAKGEIVAFTDADCIIQPDWLTQIYAGMKSTGVDIVIGRRLFPSESSGALKLFEEYENCKIEYVLNNYSKEYFFGFTNNMAVKTSVFKNIEPFQEIIRGGDTDFIHRYMFQNQNVKIAYLPHMEIIHLEILNLKKWFNRLSNYGVSNKKLMKISDYRPLDNSRRIQILLYCIRKNKYGLIQIINLCFLLIVGYIYFELGEIYGKIHFKR